MTDTRKVELSIATPAEDARTVLVNNISWGAVIAGAVIALITQFLLSLLGVAIGASTLHPATGNSPDASTFSMLSAIWYGVSGIIAAFAGGFVAARLSGRPLPSTGGLHGLTSWAVTTLILLYLLTTAIGGLVGGALNGVSAVAGGLGSTAATIAQTAAPALATADPFSAIKDQISQATGGTDPASLQNAAVAEVKAAVTGDQSQAAQVHETAAQALAKSQNMPIEQARTQVDQYAKQYQDAVTAAKAQAVKAADAAASGTSLGAFAAFAGLVLAAIAAWLGGRLGFSAPILTAASRRSVR